MKKAIIVLIVLFVNNLIIAQNDELNNQTDKSSTPKADKLFNSMWYKEAAVLYERELKKLNKKEVRNSDYLEVLKKAGDSYFFNTDMKNANRIYKDLVANDYLAIAPEYIFRYAHSLEGIGKYKEAKRWMKEFSKRTKKVDDRSEKYNQEHQTIEDVLNMEPQFVLNNLSINTKYSDFGPMYYKDKLIYSSAVDSSNYHTRIYHWNEQPFLNMYSGVISNTGANVKKEGDFSENLNTIYHEATLAFSPDEKRVYFTRNNYNGKLGRDEEGTNHLKLYSADLLRVGEDSVAKWKNVKELPFNSKSYSVGHPTVSSDGKLLYFVSDMPGSIGATDIFVVDIIDDITISYSKPRNLGDKINTAGREMFPYITDNTLYFASDGHLGLGGLDVYQSLIIKDNFTKPRNLGAPLNSELDDFAFIIKEDKNTGFVSSNRKLGKGDDDIYSFVRIEGNCSQEVTGVVKNKTTGELIPNADVILLDDAGKVIEKVLVGNDAAFKFLIDCTTKYKVIGEKTAYSSDSKVFTTPETDLKLNLDLGLNLGLELSLAPIPPKVQGPEIEIGEDIRHSLGINIIYFDYDKDFIRSPDATGELNKVIRFMQKYPTVHIDVRSHTDSRGSDSYNFNLSSRRNKSTINYIINVGGIDKSRLTGRGYGETDLINRCKNGVRCSKSEHDLNRRSEFILTKK